MDFIIGNNKSKQFSRLNIIFFCCVDSMEGCNGDILEKWLSYGQHVALDATNGQVDHQGTVPGYA